MRKYAIMILVLFSIAGCKKPLKQQEFPRYDFIENINIKPVKFCIAGHFLLSKNADRLSIIDISNPGNPVYNGKTNFNPDEDIMYAGGDTLFAGGYETISVYDVTDPFIPKLITTIPRQNYQNSLVSNGKYAWTAQLGYYHNFFNPDDPGNRLMAYKIENTPSTKTIDSLQMEYPAGLALMKDTLVVCDKTVNFYDISKMPAMLLLHNFSLDITPVKVLTNGNKLLFTNNTGLYQYQFVNDTIQFMSKINIIPK
jgi:hypothetical protein